MTKPLFSFCMTHLDGLQAVQRDVREVRVLPKRSCCTVELRRIKGSRCWVCGA